jgi:UDP-GlcNAc:undecaprenyl-phosphate GlcNAc-1-phosphate transferase
MILKSNFFLIFILIFIFSTFFIKKFKFFSKIINLYDSPDTFRKFHKEKVPLIGGFLFFLNFVILTIFSIVHGFEGVSNKLFFIFILVCFLFFFIGFLDDKFNISPNSKLISFSILILLMILSNDLFIVKNLNSILFNTNIQLANLSIFFTLTCILLFVNAFNMFDGINGQSGIYLLVISLYLLTKNIFPFLVIVFIISSIFFLIGNLQNKFFLGNNGSYFLSFLISMILIYSYNIKKIEYVEEIFILMMIPGFDLLRVAFVRVYNGQHPFLPDRNHIHYLFKNYLTTGYTNLVLFILIALPLLILFIFNSFLISLVIGTFLYIIIILFFKKFIKS